MPPTPACRRAGLTLIELIVVLVILVALAAMVVPLVGTGIGSAEIDITFTTMQRLRDAIMGGSTNAGYFADLKGVPIPGRGDTYGLPYTVADLLTTAHYVSPGPPAFNPQTQRGWRGPYISQSIGGASYQILDSFPNAGQPGAALVIQWPAAGSGIPVADWPRYVRLVSYGPDGQPSPATAGGTTFWLPGTLNATNWGDDVILYVRRDLPGLDWTNYWELKKALGP